MKDENDNNNNNKEENYKLNMSLESVELLSKYIIKYKHLNL